MNQVNLTTQDLRILQTLVGSRISQVRVTIANGYPDAVEGHFTRQSDERYLADLIRLYATLDSANPI